MTQTGRSAGFVDWLNSRMHAVPVDPGPADPAVLAAAGTFYASPAAAIGGAYTLNRVELGLLGTQARVRYR